MANQVGKTTKPYKPNYIYSVISVTMVLYLIGVFGFILIHTQKLTTYFKENIIISIELKDNVNLGDRDKLEKLIQKEPSIKSAVFISKDSAAQRLRVSIKEDFIQLLGHNPLYDAFEININADYAKQDSLKILESNILRFPVVKNMHFDHTLISNIDIKTKMIGGVILAISILLLIISLTLVNNTIRLSMYSQRFLIKSMQLVGAKSNYIIKPFVFKSIRNGLLSGILASACLAASQVYAQRFMPELEILHDVNLYLSLVLSIILIGVLISWLSTTISVRKYLRLKLDDLY